MACHSYAMDLACPGAGASLARRARPRSRGPPTAGQRLAARARRRGDAGTAESVERLEAFFGQPQPAAAEEAQAEASLPPEALAAAPQPTEVSRPQQGLSALPSAGPLPSQAYFYRRHSRRRQPDAMPAPAQPSMAAQQGAATPAAQARQGRQQEQQQERPQHQQRQQQRTAPAAEAEARARTVEAAASSSALPVTAAEAPLAAAKAATREEGRASVQSSAAQAPPAAAKAAAREGGRAPVQAVAAEARPAAAKAAAREGARASVQAVAAQARPAAARAAVREGARASPQAAAAEAQPAAARAAAREEGSAPQQAAAQAAGLQQQSRFEMPQVVFEAPSLPSLSHLTSRLPHWELEAPPLNLPQLPAPPRLPSVQLPSLQLPSPPQLGSLELEGIDLGALKQQLGHLQQLSSEQLANLRAAAAHVRQGRGQQQQQGGGSVGAAHAAPAAREQAGTGAEKLSAARLQPAERQAAAPQQQQQPVQAQRAQHAAAARAAPQQQQRGEARGQRAAQGAAASAPAQQVSVREAESEACASHSVATLEAAPASSAWQGRVVQLRQAVQASVPHVQMQMPYLGLQHWRTGGLTAWGWALLATLAALVLGLMRGLLGRRQNQAQQAVREAELRARAAQAKERQRRRFQRALLAAEDFEGTSIDSSVFASVSKKRGSPALQATTAAGDAAVDPAESWSGQEALEAAPAGAAAAAGSSSIAGLQGTGSSSSSSDINNNNPFLRGMDQVSSFSIDDWEQEEEEGIPGDDPAAGEDVYDPTSWDDQTRRAWDAFVHSSKVGQGKWWDSSQVDSGLPATHVDLDRD